MYTIFFHGLKAVNEINICRLCSSQPILALPGPNTTVLPYLTLAKRPAKSHLGHCDLDLPQPINCQCEMPHHYYLFMIIFLSPVLLFWKVVCKTHVHDVRKLNWPIKWCITKVIRVTCEVTIIRPAESSTWLAGDNSVNNRIGKSVEKGSSQLWSH